MQRALAPLDYALVIEPMPRTGAFGRDGKPWFWITDQRTPTIDNVHIAFAAADRATVNAFHAAALTAGATDNGGPGYGRSSTPATPAPSSWAPTATTSKPSAI